MSRSHPSDAVVSLFGSSTYCYPILYPSQEALLGKCLQFALREIIPKPSSCFDFVLPYWHAVELHSVPIALPSKTAEEAKMRCKETGDVTNLKLDP